MRTWSLLVAGLGILLAGCGGVTCDHPLSGEEDSILDERLIGVWEGIPDAKAEGDPPRVYVGKRQGAERTLEAIWVHLDDDDHLEVTRLRALATRLGGKTYLSLAESGEDEHVYVLLRYEIDEKDRMSLWRLDEEKVVDQIRTQAIAGRVKENPKYGAGGLEAIGQPKYTEVRITASTQALRAWLESAAETVLAPVREEGPVFRRLVFEKPTRSK